jgi:uncharacterized protein (TIGR00661 family)
MNILYGVAGQGFGHAMRAKVVIEHLRAAGHQVHILAHDQSLAYLRDFFPCQEIPGVNLVYENNRVSYHRTVYLDAKKFPATVRSFRLLTRKMKIFQPDIVFSDYESMSSFYANIHRLPLISIGNHHFITNTKISFPVKYLPEYLPVAMVTRAMTPGAKAYLVSTFALEKVTNKRTFLFPPIVQPEVVDLKAVSGKNILVYLTSPVDSILEVLKQIKRPVIVYGYNEDRRDNNILFKKFSRSGFLADLAACRFLIANSGFSLISEALFFRKPYLALPVGQQFEQIINSLYLEKLGYGRSAVELTPSIIAEFQAHLAFYRKNLAAYERDGSNRALFAKIDELLAKFTRPAVKS